MERFVQGFLRSSLVWLGIGVALGVAMAFSPRMLAFRPAHMHANLLGFVSMMIFGVAYHVIPRFTGAPLHAPRVAAAHLLVANAGLALQVGGWLLALAGPWSVFVVRAGSSLSAAGALLFIYNIWKTIDAGAAAASAVRPRTARAGAPLVAITMKQGGTT